MRKHLCGPKAVKTYGWALISGLLFFLSGLAAGGGVWPIFVGTLLAVALKTPVYWLYEHAFDWSVARANGPRHAKGERGKGQGGALFAFLGRALAD